MQMKKKLIQIREKQKFGKYKTVIRGSLIDS